VSADLTQRIVEAAALAIETQMALDDNSPEDIAHACLSAAHALAEQEGVIFTRVPEPLAPAGDTAGQYMLGAVAGYNNCRAATLAGKVTL